MIEKTAKLVMWLCLVCLLFALACTVVAFVASTPIGFILAPIICILVVWFGVNYLKEGKGSL